MKGKRDQITGASLVVIGLAFAYLISQFKTPFTAAYPGPKLLPGIAVFGLIVCGTGIFVNGCRQKEAGKALISRDGLIRIAVSFVVLCAYVLAMKYVGFLISSTVVLYVLTTYFSKASSLPTKPWARVLFSVAFSLIVYGMYVPLFGMTLPVGLLFE